VNQILNGKTKMGTDATAAAGPGATAASASDAEILTYGKARDCSLAYPWEAQQWNQTMTRTHRLYGKTLTATNIVRETVSKPTTEGKSLVAVLDSKLTKHSK